LQNLLKLVNTVKTYEKGSCVLTAEVWVLPRMRYLRVFFWWRCRTFGNSKSHWTSWRFTGSIT